MLPIDKSKIRKILVIRLGAIGDVVQTLPFVNQLKLNFPEAKISWVIENKSYPIVKEQPDIDFILFPKEKIKTLNPLKLGYFYSKFKKELQSREFDLAIDLQGLFKSGWIASMSEAKTVVGYDRSNTREGNHAFLTYCLEPIPERTMHRVDFYQKFIPALGGSIKSLEDPFQYHFQDHEIGSTRVLLHRFRVKRPFILNLGASKATKRWPLEHYARLVQYIRENYPKTHILLTGSGPDDEYWEKEILKILPPGTCASAVGKTSLRELALLVKNASFLVSPDSLALHLGSAFKIPSVGLFGGSALPIETKPYHKPYPGMSVPMSCYPCRKKTCSHHSCMKELSPLMVFQECQRFYQGK